MLRVLCALAVATGAAGLTRAADPAPPAGNWKVTVPVARDRETTILISLAEKDGKWTAECVGASDELKVTSVGVSGEAVRFAVGFRGRELFTFDGTLTKDRKKLNGSLGAPGGQLQLTTLYPTKLTKLDDPFALVREAVGQLDDGAEFFNAAFAVLEQAGDKKVPADEVRGLVERLNKAAAAFGPRWEREMTLRTIDTLSAQAGFADLAVAQARRAERLLTDDDTAATRIAVLEALVRTLGKAGKADDAKPFQAQLTKLEARDFAEYAKTNPPFKSEPFAGRKAKSDKAAVVEVFTGAECPPCVGVDLAFDGLLKTYKPSEVILLQYHFHVPRPDPLTSPDGMDRVEFYGGQIRGAPTLFISGKLGTGSGGGAGDSEKFYKQFRTTLDDLLEKPAGVKLALAVSKGAKGGYEAKATVSDLEAPGEKMTLRFALAEERVRYTGGNGIRYHHMVVRAMPGGAKGFPLPKKDAEQAVAIDPDAVRAAQVKYLDEFAKGEEPFPRGDRPLALKDLKLVALVQNDATKEILHAVQVDLEGK